MATDKIVSFLQKMLKEVESDEAALLPYLRRPKPVISDKQKKTYNTHIDESLHAFRQLGARLFRKVKIRHVKHYPDRSKTPDDFSRYLCAMHNIKDAISYDILHHISHARAQLVMERWIVMLKLAHERHDFFTAGMITFALSSPNIERTRLKKSLSPTARAILEYYQAKYANQSFIFSLQEKKAKEGLAVIPLLSALANMMDMVNNQPETNDPHQTEKLKNYAKDQKTRYFSGYLKMKKAIRRHSHKKMDSCIDLISKAPDAITPAYLQMISANMKQLPLSSRLNMGSIVSKLGFYGNQDQFYIAKATIENIMLQLSQFGDERRLSDAQSDLVSEIMKMVRNTIVSDAEKYPWLDNLYIERDEDIHKCLRPIIDNLVIAYYSLHLMDEKRRQLEPLTKLERKTTVTHFFHHAKNSEYNRDEMITGKAIDY